MSSVAFNLFLLVSLTLQAFSEVWSCSSGWTINGSSCYRVFKTKKKWDDAEAECVSEGGHLVSITSDSENAVVFNLRGRKRNDDVWIGLNKAVENSFVWSDGTNSSYRYWSGGQRSGGSSDCTLMEYDGKWDDKKCTVKDYYVCETPAPTTHSPTTIASSLQCQSGWTRSGLSCYILVTKSTTWDAAETDCIRKGGNLTSILTASENSVVLGVRGTSSAGTSDAWIGLHDKAVENTFVWIDGKQSTYTNWDSSVPEPNGSGDCVRIRSDGTWRDIQCTASYPYVCKSAATLSTYTTQEPTTISATTSPHTSAGATTSVVTTVLTITTKSSTTNSPSTSLSSNPPSTTVAATTDRSTTRHPTTSVAATTLSTSAPTTLSTSVPTTVSMLTTTEDSAQLPTKTFTSTPSSEITRSDKSTTRLTRTPTARASSTRRTVMKRTSTSRDQRTPTPTDETINANEAQTSASNNTTYIGVAAAGTVIIIMAFAIFAFLFWRRKKNKSDTNTSQTHVAGSSDTSGVANATPGGTHFTRCGSATNVNVYFEPATAMESKPTRAPIEIPPCEDEYLAPAFTEILEKMQSHEQQERNHVAMKTTNDHKDEYQEINEKTDVKYAEVIAEGVHTENASTHYEFLVEPSEELPTNVDQNTQQGYKNMAYGEDTQSNDAETTAEDQTIFTTSLNAESGDAYWEPATTEQELYGQLERRRFRHIDRRDVTYREEIGSGAFGVVEKAVWRVNDKEKLTVAVKTLTNEANADDRVKFLREAAINGQFRHRNIVGLHGVVTIGSPIMLVLEYMQNGDLKNYLAKQRAEQSGRYPSSDLGKTLLRMCRDIASGMKYLTRKFFVHRDVAARNILLSRQLTCKIADFGMARDVSEDNYYTITGGKVPIKWCAPETWNYKRFSSASDVWSYGVVLYEVWSVGRRPFGSMKNGEVMTKVEIGYRLPPPPGCSRSLYHLMIDCWHPDSHERPSFATIMQRLAADDNFLLTNKQGEEIIEGKLGDELNMSENCYKDLQDRYARY